MCVPSSVYWSLPHFGTPAEGYMFHKVEYIYTSSSSGTRVTVLLHNRVRQISSSLFDSHKLKEFSEVKKNKGNIIMAKTLHAHMFSFKLPYLSTHLFYLKLFQLLLHEANAAGDARNCVYLEPAPVYVWKGRQSNKQNIPQTAPKWFRVDFRESNKLHQLKRGMRKENRRRYIYIYIPTAISL